MTAPSLRDIMEFVAFHCGVEADEIRSQRRFKNLILPRQMYFWLARKQVGKDGNPRWSTPTIGLYCGGRDHSTVLHGVREMQRKIDEGLVVVPEYPPLPMLLRWVPRSQAYVEPEAPKPEPPKWRGPIPCPGTAKYEEWRRLVVERAA